MNTKDKEKLLSIKGATELYTADVQKMIDVLEKKKSTKEERLDFYDSKIKDCTTK